MTSTDAGGCTFSDDVKVIVPDIPTGLAGESKQICEGESLDLGLSNPSTGYAYSWTAIDPVSENINIINPNSFSPTVAPTVTTTYRLIITNTATSCTSTEYVIVDVSAKPTIADVDMAVQCGPIAAVDLTAQIPPYETYFNRVWYINSVPNTVVASPNAVVPTLSTNYFLVAENAQGCPDTARVGVLIENAITPVIAPTAATNCPSNTIDLTDYQGLPSTFGSTLEWHSDNTTNPATLLSSLIVGIGTYYLFEIGPNGCISASDNIVVSSPCVENCNDGIDNDGDGLIDCMDFDCGCAISEICITEGPLVATTYNVWHTGSGGGLDFNQLQTSGPLTGYPSTFADLGTTSLMPKQEGGATFCDPRSGEVIIYSDGRKAWDKDGNEFSTSDAQNRFNTLSTNLSSAAGTPIIVPAPGQCNANEELYIFFTDDHGGATPELYYVIVNVPAGTISNPTQLTSYEMSESISAVQVSCDTTWIVYRNELDMEAIRWTSAGFEAPVVTANIHKDTDQRYSSAFSLDGYRFAATLGFYPFESHEMMVANFDVSNGQFSNILYLNPFSKTVPIDPYVNYDVAFSPDGTKLYTTYRRLSGGDNIVQYNLSAGDATDIENSGIIVGSDSQIGGLMNGPDGRIYASTGLGANGGINSIHVIDFPNLAGVACNFQADLLSPGGAVTGGLNNMVYGLGATSCIPNISGNIGSNICEDITLDVLDCYLGDGGPYDISYKYNGVWDTIFAQTLNASNEILLTGLSTGIYDSIQVADGNSCASNYISLTLQDSSCPEICDNGFDDNLNGLTDCEETICIPIANPATLTTCDNSSGAGSGTFFLPDVNTDVSGGATGVTVSLYVTLSDAQNGVNDLTSSYDSPNSTIYARVENDISGCFATAVVTLTVGAACAEICDDGIDNDGDGQADCDDLDCSCCEAKAPVLIKN